MTVKEIFLSMTDQLSYSQGSKITTSEFAFALLTRFTPRLLLFFSFIVTIRQIFGQPIECQPDPSYESFKTQIETRCWIEGSYIIREHLTGTIGKNIINYGVGTKMRVEERMYQTYYQWVTPTLLIMAVVAYFPHFIWHNWESGAMEKLLKDIDSPLLNEECWSTQKDRLLRFLHGPKRYHNEYAVKYYTCELIAFITLILNMQLMSLVFNNFWIEYFPAVESLLKKDMEGFAKYSSILFPSQAKCDYFNFGPSGSIQRIDALCLLPQNVINEKIFVFLYFWMLILVLCMSVHTIKLFMKLWNQCRHDKSFGYMLVLSIYKKNLSPVLIDDLLQSRKQNQL